MRLARSIQKASALETSHFDLANVWSNLAPAGNIYRLNGLEQMRLAHCSDLQAQLRDLAEDVGKVSTGWPVTVPLTPVGWSAWWTSQLIGWIAPWPWDVYKYGRLAGCTSFWSVAGTCMVVGQNSFIFSTLSLYTLSIGQGLGMHLGLVIEFFYDLHTCLPTMTFIGCLLLLPLNTSARFLGHFSGSVVFNILCTLGTAICVEATRPANAEFAAVASSVSLSSWVMSAGSSIGSMVWPWMALTKCISAPGGKCKGVGILMHLDAVGIFSRFMTAKASTFAFAFSGQPHSCSSHPCMGSRCVEVRFVKTEPEHMIEVFAGRDHVGDG
eukprot:Skav232186  [mRNA]  locus=scaffold4523:44071:54390:- [translate_table: standard]